MKTIGAFFVVLFTFLDPCFAFSEYNWSGTTEVLYFQEQDSNHSFGEHNTRLFGTIGVFETELRIRQQSSPVPTSFFEPILDSDVLKGSISFPIWASEFIVGHFNAELGRGLVYKSIENRDLLIDNGLLGVYASSYMDGIELTAFSGAPRDIYGDRSTQLVGTELSSRIFDDTRLGMTRLVVTDSEGPTNGGSIFIQTQLFDWDIYSEWAKHTLTDSLLEDGQSGFYFQADTHVFGLTASVEYSNYHSFFTYNNQGNVLLNEPPVLTNGAGFRLMEQSVIPPDGDSQGLGFELSVPFRSTWIDIRYLFLTDHLDNRIYDEILVSSDLDVLKMPHTLLVFASQTVHSDHMLNVIAKHVFHNFISDKPLELTAEFQAVEASSDYQNYSYQVSFNPFDWLNFAVLAESTSQQMGSAKNSWIGFQSKLDVSDRVSLDVFYGDRQAGKFCSGGICIYKPEFSGFVVSMSAQY